MKTHLFLQLIARLWKYRLDKTRANLSNGIPLIQSLLRSSNAMLKRPASKLSLLLLVPILFSYSCRKNIDETTITQEQPEPTVFIETTIQGLVIDENGQPLPNVLVQTVNRAVSTDAEGRFRINQAEVKKSGEVVRANFNGYFEGASYANFSADGTAYTQIQLMEKSDFELVDPNIGKTITDETGLQVIIQPNSLRLPSGNNFPGNAKVYTRWIDPSDENMPGLMPGALVATDADGNPLALRSYGMLAIEAETESGQELTFSELNPVDVLLPIPESLEGDAPANIDLWQYDFGEAEWVLEGDCEKVVVNGKPCYQFKIDKPGYWNCDVSVPAVCISTNIFNPDGTPACYVKVIMEDLTDNFIYWGYADSLGYFCGSVPQDALLLLTIEDLCDNTVYTAEIGPFSEDEQLPDITIDEQIEAFAVNVTASVLHCATTDIPDGHVAFRYPGTLAVRPFTTGGFDLDIAFKCTAFPALEITAYSAYQEQQTTPFFQDLQQNINLGIINTCEALSDYFYLTIDGTEFWTAPTQFYTATNDDTHLTLEGLSGGGTFQLKILDYNGVGDYNENVFLKVEGESGPPFFPDLTSDGTTINANITEVDDDFIIGTLAGTAFLNGGFIANVIGNFKIRVAP